MILGEEIDQILDRIVSMLTKLIQRLEEDAFSRSGSGESPGRVGSGAAVLGAGAFAGKNAQTMTRLGILYWHFKSRKRDNK